MNRWNVIWLLVDSARAYRSGLDDRDRIDLMDEMAPEVIEFERVVTSAPSSVMSVSAMMTGMPSYQIARDYENFLFDPQAFSSVPWVLEAKGYDVNGLVFFREGRERFANLFKQVDRSHWPRKLRRSTVPYWTNDEMNSILRNLLVDGLQEPFFLFVHYNIRRDPTTSAKVATLVHHFKRTGVYDQSIFILCSDHGYPDPSRGLGPEWFKDRGLGHDLVMTNDNLLIPLLLHYPGAEPCKISTTISSLDIGPTVLDLLQVEPDEKLKRQIKGCSLKPLIEGAVSSDVFEARYIWSDNRFFFQLGRITALIRGSKKYIYHHDTGQEAFFDFAVDPMEDDDLIDHSELQEEINAFRNAFAEAQAEARRHHLEYMLQKVYRQARGNRIDSGGRLMVIDLSDWHGINLVLEVLHDAFKPSTMALLTNKEYQLDNSLLNEVLLLSSLAGENRLRQTLSLCDNVVVIGNRLTGRDIRRHLGYEPKNLLVLDSNMEPVIPSRWKAFPKYVRARSRFYLAEPQMVIEDLRRVIRAIIQRLKP